MKNIRKSYKCNIIIFILELVAIIWMFSGFKIIETSALLSDSGFAMLKYFTIDSNILMCIIALIFAINDKKVIDGKSKKISDNLYKLKLIATTSVAFTMLVTCVFLVPTSGIVMLYDNSIILLHVICPLLSILTFVLFEKNNSITFKDVFISLIPIILYAIFYIYNLIIHLDNLSFEYDWYGLYLFETNSFIIIPIIVLVAYFILSTILWKLNSKKK